MGSKPIVREAALVKSTTDTRALRFISNERVASAHYASLRGRLRLANRPGEFQSAESQFQRMELSVFRHIS